MKKIIAGLKRFKANNFNDRKALFANLANNHNPEVLFITCADSRIDPNLITQSEPGNLFVIRNAGNIIPPHRQNDGEISATIDYAVAVVGVKHIVVCGHSDCNAMKGVLNTSAFNELPAVQSWLDHSRAAVDSVKIKFGQATLNELNELIKQNVLLQIKHLKTNPVISSYLLTNQIVIHAWIYDIGSGTVEAFDENKKAFVSVDECYESLNDNLG